MRNFPAKAFKDFPREFAQLKKLKTPAKVQDFLNTIEFNFEKKGETYHSPVMVLREKKAHCIEGALLAAAALWANGHPPLIMDLKTTDADVDHVVALFKEGNRWGAISKTNHAVLRYREPVYRDPREVAMSYFHEYFLHSGVKTLRSYSVPLDLSRLDDAWLTSDKKLDDVALALDTSKHIPILRKGGERKLRLAEPVEIAAGKIVEWRKGKNGK